MTMTKIGLRLREARIERQLSQTAFAAAVGKSKQLASAWENGRAEILAKDLRSLVMAFDLDPAIILGTRRHSAATRNDRTLSDKMEFFRYWRTVEPTLLKLINVKLRGSTPSKAQTLKAIRSIVQAIGAIVAGRK